MRYLVHHMLRDSAAQYPENEALVAGEQRLNYATFAVRVSTFAKSLQDRGVRRGDRVAIYLPPGATLAQAIFAASQAGAVFVPIHHGLFPEQVAHILRDSGATTLITDALRWKSLQTIIDDTPELQRAVIEGQQDTPSPVATTDLSKLIRIGQTSAPVEHCIGKDLAAILYTSGSTGRPKGVMLSHANILAGAAIVADYLQLDHSDRLLAALPFSFDAGLNQLTSAVWCGATTVMVNFRFGRDIVRMLSSERITGLAGVPPLWSLLADPSSGLAKQIPSHLRYITNTGGAMPTRLLAKLRGLLPDTSVYLMYGLTEAFRSTYLPPEELDRRPTSMGKAIPNTEILVLNEEGKHCAPGEVGELVHHGPTVSLGYWGHPELTARVLRPHPHAGPGSSQGDRVCYSGDLVRLDDDGFLYFVGRRDNQIKSSGFRISPTEVEEVICQFSGVQHAAVVGAPDPMLGQHLVAFVVGADHSPPDANALLAHCAGAMPRYMVPKRIEFVSQLPLTSSGKINYPRLRDYVTEANPSLA